jgi:cyclic dehypoxanthinyl futalosine synthase
MPITRQQALECFQSDDLIGLGMEADAVRRCLHPEGTVTYLVASPLNLTQLGSDPTAVADHAARALDLGASAITLNGAPEPAPDIAWYETALGTIRRVAPGLSLDGLTAPQTLAIAGASNLALRETLIRLQAAGLEGLSGVGATFTPAPHSCTVADWIDVHRTAHALGLPTTAAMLFGAGESIEQRLDLLEAIRALQAETGGFTAFTPIAFVPAARELDGATAVERLKTLAIARIFLDGVPNLQASADSRTSSNLKVLQMALRFGANDAGSIDPAEGTSEEDLRRVIRDAGLRPAPRNATYSTVLLA